MKDWSELSGMDTFMKARIKEIEYHERFYEKTALFTPGSWLARPVKTVMEYLELVPQVPGLKVLDLACGPGRNSIPIAQRIQPIHGKVTAVDLLPSAIDKLKKNAGDYGVEESIEAVCADAEFYEMGKNRFHYIIACSCLEHLSSEAAFVRMLDRLKEVTAAQGIICMMMSTEITEIDKLTGTAEDGLIELNLSSDRAFSLMREAFSDWEVLLTKQIQQDIPEVKAGREVVFRSQWITFAARK